jgi:hypothetical protein
MTIEWDRLTQPEFDRIIEALVRDRFGADVRAVNGKGGDEGIDIAINVFGRLWIMQLKYYPGGFSTEHRKRRQNIKKSYTKAQQHQPVIWSLVVPSLCTTSEHEHVTGLSGGKPSPHITVIDRDDLDKWMADAPHIEAYFHRTTNSEFERLAALYNRETSALLGGVSDVLTRTRDLGSVVNTLDPEWAIGFSSAPGGSASSVTVVPRHPGAQIQNPIRMAVGIDDLDPELNRQLLHTIGYAMAGTVVLPADAVRSVHISGGPFVDGEYPPGEVHLVTPPAGPGRGKTVELRAFQRDNTDVQIFEGTITHAGPGPAGGTIEADFCEGHLTVRMRLTYTTTPADEVFGPPGMDLSYDFAGTRPGLVAEILSTARLVQLAKRIEILVDGLSLATVALPLPETYDAELVAVEEYAADLDIVQRHVGRRFTMPTHMNDDDRIRMRVARALVQGHIVASPRVPRLTLELTGEDTEDLRACLERGEMRLCVDGGPFSETVEGRKLTLGDVTVIHPRARILNAEAALAALDAGTAAGVEIHLEPVDEPYFYLALEGVGNPDINQRALAAWNLYGLPQPGLPPSLADQQ